MNKPYQDELGGWILYNGTRKLHFNTLTEVTLAQSQQDYIEAVKNANRDIWEGINHLVNLQRQWNALDYGNTLSETDGVTASQLGSVVFDTANALVAVLNSGHATNMAKLL